MPRSLSGRRAARSYFLTGGIDPDDLRAALSALGARLPIDLVLQSEASRLRRYRLAVFDMDSTLIRCEVIDELARCAGVGEQVSAITRKAMEGELDFSDSYAHRLSLLKGLDASHVDTLAANLPVTEGVAELLTTLRARGTHTAIVSGGFLPFAEALQRQFGFDEVYANGLDIRDGKVTGIPQPPIVDGEFKARAMLEMAQRLGISPAEIVAVGDGANDLPMLNAAGFGVAYRAKPLVADQADCHIRHVGLDGLLYLLGSKSELAGG